MSKAKPTYRQLEERLAAAEPVVEALKHHEVDAVVGEGKIAFLLLRKVEEALLESDEAFRAMFDLSGVGMVQADSPAFRFSRVNPKFCQIVGYSAEELLTKTWLELTHPDDRHSGMKELAQVLRGQSDRWSIEKRYVRKDGSTVWVSVNGTALRDEAGRTVRIMAMIEDVTARKRAEQELRDSHKDLEGRVQERTSELSQTIGSLRSEVAKRTLAEQTLRDRSEQLRKLASELTLAEHRERRRVAQILHDHLREVLVGAKSPAAPLERAEVKTVRQALMEVQRFIDQSIGRPGDKSSAEGGPPTRRTKAAARRPHSPLGGKSSGKSRRPGR
jgi:PAS domain S-box-containing protein